MCRALSGCNAMNWGGVDVGCALRQCAPGTVPTGPVYQSPPIINGYFYCNSSTTCPDPDPVPQPSFYIAAFSPPSFPIPVKIASSNNASAGTVTFELLNIRQPYVFRIVEGDLTPHTSGPPSPPLKYIANSSEIVPEALPMQIR